MSDFSEVAPLLFLLGATHPPFLVLTRGKGGEKKVKASGTPAKFAGYAP